jgi:hypothetical protein
MSNIDSAWATPNELLAPRNFWREQQQTDAYTQNVALQKQHQERELEGDDYKTIANTAGYLLSLPNEQSRADAWSKIYPDLPDHIRARAPSAPVRIRTTQRPGSVAWPATTAAAIPTTWRT